MKTFERVFPWLVVSLGAMYLVAVFLPPRDRTGAANIWDFASLPIVDGGRVKPFDTLARTNLMIISGRQTFKDEDGKYQPAVKWLLDVMTSGRFFDNPAAHRHKVFRVENDQVLNTLGLSPRAGFRYSIDEFAPKFALIEKEALRAQKLDAHKRDLFDNKILELRQHLELYLLMAELMSPHTVPPISAGDDWKPFLQALQDARDGKENRAAISMARLLSAYSKNDTESFNTLEADYRKQMEKQVPQQLAATQFEVLFNHFEPFYQSALLYVFVFVLAFLSWIGWSEPLRRASFWLAILALAVHTWALIARMYLQGRPPVTNLYSSAVFIGWGSVILGLFLEWIFRIGIGSVVAGVTGASTLVIAHYLSTSGDTLEMMQAVLDTNIWLATHVTCVALGYTATFAAGFIGIIYVVAGTLTRFLTRDLIQTLGKMIYGVVCFATLFSFTGTVLGGIWADQSWGRFWGWDPKENGALIIVLWNALLLHARWGGIVKQRGMAVLAVGGNIVTAWSWFGVNMLGVGLHSYGFMSGAVFWLVAFIASQLAIIGIGCLPLRYWLSFAPLPAQR